MLSESCSAACPGRRGDIGFLGILVFACMVWHEDTDSVPAKSVGMLSSRACRALPSPLAKAHDGRDVLNHTNRFLVRANRCQPYRVKVLAISWSFTLTCLASSEDHGKSMAPSLTNKT